MIINDVMRVHVFFFFFLLFFIFASSATGNPAETIYVIGGTTPSSLTRVLSPLTPSSGLAWETTRIPALEYARTLAPAIAFCPNSLSIVVAGGSNLHVSSGALATAAIFSLTDSSRAWSNLPSFSGGVTFTSGICLGDGVTFMLVGGSRSSIYSSSCVKLNTYNKVWYSAGNLLKGRNALATVLFQGSVVALGGWDGTQPLASAEQYSTSSDYWSSFPSLLEPRDGAGGAVILNKIYVSGGANENLKMSEGHSANVEVYDDAKGKWTYLSSGVPSGSRPGGVVTSFQDLLVLVGGVRAQVDVYDPQTSTWSTFTSLSPTTGGLFLPGVLTIELSSSQTYSTYGLRGPSIVVIGGAELYSSLDVYTPFANHYTGFWTGSKYPLAPNYFFGSSAEYCDTLRMILIVGGFDFYYGVTNLAVGFNFLLRTWTTFPSMPQYIQFSVLLSLDASCSEALIIGGSSSSIASSNCFKFNALTGLYSSFPPMFTARMGHAGVILSNAPLVLGGTTGTAVLNLVEQYDETSMLWRSFPSFRTARKFFGACVVKSNSGRLNMLFIAGGLDSSSKALDTLEYLNGTTWFSLSSVLPSGPRYSFALSYSPERGLIYALGGIYPTVDVYDPVSSYWRREIGFGEGRESITAALPIPDPLSKNSMLTNLSLGIAMIGGSLFSVEPIQFVDYLAPNLSAAALWDPFKFPPPPFSAGLRPAVDYCHQDGLLMVAGGTGGSGSASNQAFAFSVGASEWMTLDSLVSNRKFTAGVCIPDLASGRSFFIVTGGNDGSGALITCEAYDVYDDSWSTYPSLLSPREAHALLLYQNSTLTLGGFNSTNVLKSCESLKFVQDFYWSSFPSLLTPRRFFGAAVVVLPSNNRQQLYVAGGQDASFNALFSVEWFDGAQWSFLSSPLPSGGRAYGSAVSLPSGKFVVLGGTQQEIDVYDVVDGTWSHPFPSMSMPSRYYGSAVVFRDPFVNSSSSISTTSTPSSPSSFSSSTAPPQAEHATIVAISGDLISRNLPITFISAYSFNSASSSSTSASWNLTAFPVLPVAHGSQPAVAYCSNSKTIIVAGGFNGSSVIGLVSIFKVGGQWTSLPPLPVGGRVGLAGICLFDGSTFFVTGGSAVLNGSNSTLSTMTISTDQGSGNNSSWILGALLKEARDQHGMVLFSEAPVVLGGSQHGRTCLRSVESFSLNTQSWQSLSPLRYARCSFASAVVMGYIFVAGGMDAIGAPYTSIEKFDGMIWTTLENSPLPSGPRTYCAGLSLNNAYFAILGGTRDFIDVYDVGANKWTDKLPPLNSFRYRFVALELTPPSRSITTSPTTGSHLSSTSQSGGMTTSSPNDASSSTSLNPAIFGGIVGVIVLVLLFVIIFLLARNRRVRHRIHTTPELMRLEAIQRRSQALLERGLSSSTLFNAFSESELNDGELKVMELKKDEILLEAELGCGSSGVVSRGRLKLGPTKRKKIEKLLLSIEQATSSNLSTPADVSNLTVAVKSPSPGFDLEDEVKFFCECQLLSMIRHPHIVTLIGVCTDVTPLMMVVEYFPRGNLRDYLRSYSSQTGLYIHDSLDAEVLASFLRQICSALQFLESNSIVHRDVAARNVLVGSNHIVKLSDFGLSRWMSNTDYYRQAAEDRVPFKWMPLEAIDTKTFTSKSDVWAFGILCWEVFSFGESPYNLMTVSETVQYLRDGQRLKQPDGCPATFYGIMLKCWLKDASSRPSFVRLGTMLIPSLPRSESTHGAKRTPSLSNSIHNDGKLLFDEGLASKGGLHMPMLAANPHISLASDTDMEDEYSL